MSLFLGIEVGGSKLQLAIADGTGNPFRALVRMSVSAPGKAAEIQRQILAGVTQVLADANVPRDQIAGIGIGFGGPVNSAAGTIVTSHQVSGWDQFPIVNWLTEQTGWRAVLHNDADAAAFAEAKFGAGRGFDPVCYVTVGSGIGGGLIVDGKVYRGQGAGALEIGHLRPGYIPTHVPLPGTTVESIASGFGITDRARRIVQNPELANDYQAPHPSRLIELCKGDPMMINTQLIAQAARAGDRLCLGLLNDAIDTLGWALAQAITLINPARIVIGGGVALMGEKEFLSPVRRACRRNCFPPFVDLAEIVPAALEEEVVVHGALALARAEFASLGT